MTGMLNGIPIAADMMGVGDTTTGFLSVDMGPIPDPGLGGSLGWCFVHITVKCGSAAVETGGAINMLTLTDGNFTRDLTIEFFDGSVMRAKQSSARMGPSEFFVTSDVSGAIPLLPPGAPFQALDYADLYTQLDPDTVHVLADRLYLADLDGDGLLDPEPYRVTATILIDYDGAVQLPFDQRLKGEGLLTGYDPISGTRNFALINTMTADCYPDCDGNGLLDFFDFLCFQNAFALGDAYADCDDTGMLDFFDFLCFQNAFAIGCPG
ncbi:MAG: hypothetical protein ACF8R7_16905 [Phycisphaerales bacterium JB039]